MTSGLLEWGQSGHYAAWDDRQVVTALGGKRTGVVTPVTMTAASGLNIAVSQGWLAVADAGDGTLAVVSSPIALQVPAAPGGAAPRTDELWCQISNPDTATWTLAVVPAGS